MTRRELLKLLATSSIAAPALARVLRAQNQTASAPARAAARVSDISIAPGPFGGTRDSLNAYRIPQWFADAKFGIWAHWGPQSAAEYGDWYARNIYIDKTEQHKHHVATYGHPSKFGYKDIIPLWHAREFNADRLVGLYKKAGAKYFMSMGVHCDNFDLWNSKFQPRWNSVAMGPKRDIVSEFRAAARKHGLPFGVSDHLWPTSKWISVSKGADTKGDLKDVPYDGANPAYADLYGDFPYPDRKLDWNENDITDATKAHWFDRIKDLIDQHDPDIIYQDGHIPFGDRGLALVAHYYNRNMERRGGKLEAVYTSKRREDSLSGACVFDIERAVPDDIIAEPWQICTCIGAWHYDRRKLGGGYKTPKRVIDMLLDVVSRNGNLLLNFPLPNSGALDSEELVILEEITNWMQTNGEGIYATRPWKIFGEGPSRVKNDPKVKYNESLRKDLTPEDVRYTTKGRDLYAFVMGKPENADNEALLPALAPSRGLVENFGNARDVRVTMLGYSEPLKWTLTEQGLRVRLPATLPGKYAHAIKIAGIL